MYSDVSRVEDGSAEVISSTKYSDSSGEESDDSDDRLDSQKNKGEIDDCFESPLQSLESEFLAAQRFYSATYMDKSKGNLCSDCDDKEEHTSKTIKAATLELSSPRIQMKPCFLTRSLSLSTGSLYEVVVQENSLTSSSSVENNLPNLQILNGNSQNYGFTSETVGVDGKYVTATNKTKTDNLQTRRKQTKHLELHSSEAGNCLFQCCENAQEAAPTLQLPSVSYDLNDVVPSSPSSPTERHLFFKVFSELIRSGISGSDKKLQNMCCVNEPPKVLNSFLWKELLAWHKGCSMDEIDSFLELKRQTIPIIVDEVLHFSVAYDIESNKPVPKLRNVNNESRNVESGPLLNNFTDPAVDSIESSNDSSLTNFINDDVQMASLNSDIICECSDTLSRICQNCTDKETTALYQTETLIAKLDNVEHLYPSLRELATDHNMYKSKTFTCRIKTLHIWLNLTYDLRHKINTLANLFGISDKLKAGWPSYVSDEASTLSEESPISCCTESKPTSLLRVQFKNTLTFMSSPSSSGSDRSEKSRTSYPSSPDVQLSNPFDTHLDSASSESSSELQSKGSKNIYHKYVDYALRHKGLKQTYRQLFTFIRPILYRLHSALKKPKKVSTSPGSEKVVTNQSSNYKAFENALPVKKEFLEELSMHGVWSTCFQQMALPTFHKPFFFMLRVLIDVIHECLRLRLEQQPAKPSSLSVTQLMKECKEVLKAATQTRQKYINLTQTVLGEGGKEIIEAQLDSFDSHVKAMLLVYLDYLHHRILLMQSIKHNTLHQKSYLEEEWSFVRVVCPHIPGGEAAAAKKFCFMSIYLLNSIGTSLTNKVSKHIRAYEKIKDDSYDSSADKKKSILEACREIKHEFQKTSDRARQVITLAKSLRKDLEIAAEFAVLVPSIELLEKLRDTGHIRVTAPHITGHVMFVPGNLQHCEMFIWELVDMTCGHEALESGMDQAVYLIMMQCSKSELKGLYWEGPTIVLEPTAEANITLSHVEVDGLLLVVNHSSQLISQCKKFQKVMGKTLRINKQQTSCNHAIAEALNDLKTEALKLWDSLTEVVKCTEEKLDVMSLSSLDELDRIASVSSYRDVLHQGYKFAFEYQKAVMRLITGEARHKFYESLANFASQWMAFVINKCEEGRGVRPMWAKQGLDFLQAVYDSAYGQSISDLEFEIARNSINACLRHLLGCSEKSPLASQGSHSPKSGIFGRFPFSSHRYSRISLSHSDSLLSSSPGPGDEVWRRKRSRDESVGESKSNGDIEVKPVERVRKKIEELEAFQQEKLVKKGVIGHVSDLNIQHTPFHVSARRVTFPWQRCFKIGEGRFGKVYTAVNNKTGELVAMKEIRLQPNDHRAIKEALDEIRTFEGIKHKNVVRYYGVEVHREEMLIFMEYCNEGSLENAVQSQLNLPESLIRKYTRQLLEAVNVLHEHGIVHRDIKSANIFLTSDGNLKLGDFGCSIKLKNTTTMPGELCGFVGTPAYMAPEVFTRNIGGGHGRAADIWSFGCVVLEMFDGKRPWHDLENSYQIMFTVGMGGIPEIPDSLNDEAKDFLENCLVYNPFDRWTASQLLDHPFTKMVQLLLTWPTVGRFNNQEGECKMKIEQRRDGMKCIYMFWDSF